MKQNEKRPRTSKNEKGFEQSDSKKSFSRDNDRRDFSKGSDDRRKSDSNFSRDDRKPERGFEKREFSKGSDDRRRSDSNFSRGDRKPERGFEKREFSRGNDDRGRSDSNFSRDDRRPERGSEKREFPRGNDDRRRNDSDFSRGDKKPEGRFEKREFSRGSDDRRRSDSNFSRGDKKPEDRFEKRDFSRGNDDRRRSDSNFSRGDRKSEGRFEKREFSRGSKPSERRFGDYSESERSFKKFSGKRKSDEPFEYGQNIKPQKRPDYSEESLKKSLSPKQREKISKTEEKTNDLIRLNRYIANAGLCSRREADDFIESGQITVNGKTITEMGYQVKSTDVVKYGRKILNREKLVYVLLNKPKDFITTTEDPEGRRTVMELVAKAGTERIYPVGRLDRATTGLLLFTNDGEIAEKLSHPSNEIRKIYQVEIDKPITTEDFDKLVEGVELEDGFVKPDEVSVITPDQQVIGIEIHSGKNRVVRRIFESLGYEVTKLDRTTYSGLTKKDLPRGNWRFLTEKEVIRLKYMI